MNVPVLRYLHSLEQKVDSFIYHSVCGRGIYTLKELEIDVVCMLNAFAIYPLNAREFGDDGMESDSNNSDEVYDSDPQDNSGEYGRQGPYGGTKGDSQQQPATRFRDFGVGSLFVHPIVQKYFGPIPNEVPNC